MTAGSISTGLARVLFTYSITPQRTTEVSPAEFLLGRSARTRLDLLKLHTAKRVERKQLQQKAAHDAKAKSRTFRVGDKVYAKNFGTGSEWLPGEITGTTGPVSYTVRPENEGAM